MTYEHYLFSRLVLDAGLIDKELEYDRAYDLTTELYDSFTDSIFDDGNKDLYGCILDFIEWKRHQ
jgi:hypothetical protein